MQVRHSGMRLGALFGLTLMASVAGSCTDDQSSRSWAAGAPWQVRRGALRAPDGRAALLRGVNIASSHKTAPYFGFHSARDFQRVRTEWGMNSVRLLMTWAAIEPERGAYDEEYLDQLAQRLDWAEAAGLWVVLDMHQDLFGEGFGGDGAPRWSCDSARYAAFQATEPWFLNYLDENVVACFDNFWTDRGLQQHYFDAWRKVAQRFAKHPAVVGFDPMNEPFWGSTEVTHFEAVVLQSFYERAVASVRQVAPHWVAFLEPCSSRNLGVASALQPFGFENVVYAPHSYDLGAEAGNGFDPAHRATLISNVARMQAEAEALGAALWIGEYGGNADHPNITEYMDATYAAAGQVAAGSMYWAYDRDSGYGLLLENGQEKSALLQVLVRPYPEFVSGDPIGFAFDPESRRFSFSFRPDPQATEPTLISLPKRVYPDGYRVACDGCQIEREEARLVVRRAPPSQQVTLVVTP